jgi:hypothetical protein
VLIAVYTSNVSVEASPPVPPRPIGWRVAFDRTWSSRIAEVVPLPPWSIALLLCAGLSGINLLVGLWPTPSEEGMGRANGFGALITLLNLGYSIASEAPLRTAVKARLARARIVLDLSDAEFEATCDRIDRPGPAWILGATLLALVSFLLTSELLFEAISNQDRLRMQPGWPWAMLTSLVGYVIIVQQATIWVHVSREAGALGRSAGPGVLLEPESLTPLAGSGLLVMLTVALYFAALTLPMTLTTEASGLAGIVWNSFLILLMIGLGAGALLLTSRPAHGRVRELKQQELARIRVAIAGSPEAMVESPMAAQADALRGTALLDYLDRIVNTPEWPINLRVLRRFLLYTLIPLGSWVSAALVERGLGRLLD